MIKFKYGTQAEYDAISAEDIVAEALYFIEDTQRIYRGTSIIASNNVITTSEVPAFEDAVDGVIYVVTSESGVTETYVKGSDKMESASGVSDGSLTIDAFDDASITTSTDDMSNVDDTSLITAGAAKALVDSVSGLEWESLSTSVE